MSAPKIDINAIVPTAEDFEKLLKAKLSYEAKQKTPERDSWNKSHWSSVPWGIAYDVSKSKYSKSVALNTTKGRKAPAPKADVALRYFIVAIAIDWQELIEQLRRTLKVWGFTTDDLQYFATNVWLDPAITKTIANACDSVTITELTESLYTTKLSEAVEKHDTLNSRLFTKDGQLKERVRNKMLEIVDEFLEDLKSQDIKIQVDDILFIGSNASYNYTKDSDIDLHIVANTKAVNYPEELGNALYSAYRSLFNKQLDIQFFDTPVEIFVEIESSKRVSNGIYSVKKDKWIKKPVQEDIPDFDKDALSDLVGKWEAKCKKLLDESDKLKDETKVVKLIEDIYDKLRKKGVAKGEYSIENLAFKELRNLEYLDKLKELKNDLVSKRLSLEETLYTKQRNTVISSITAIAGSTPIVQENGMFFIYNIEETKLGKIKAALEKLPEVCDVVCYDSGKYDFSNTLHMAMHNVPFKYYNIRGKLCNV